MRMSIVFILIIKTTLINGIIKLFMMGSGIRLSDYCNQQWTDINNIPISNPILNSNITSLYTCNSLKFIFIRLDNSITLDYNPKPSFHGQNSTVSCFVILYGSRRLLIEAILMLHDSSFNNYKTGATNLTEGSNNLTLSTPVYLDEHKWIGCSLDIKLHHEEFNESYFETTNITIAANMPPTNVRPDKIVAPINETITCIGDAYPPLSIFDWDCQNSNWESVGSQLTFTQDAYLVCNCTAKNRIGDQVYEGTWSGVLKTDVTESGGIVFKKRDTSLRLRNLDDLNRECWNWEKGLTENDNFTSENSTVIVDLCAVYKCSDNDDLKYLVIPTIRPFRFIYKPASAIIGQNLSIICSVRYYVEKSFNVYSKIYIYNSSNYEFNFTYEFHTERDYAVTIFTYHVVRSDVFRTFYCKWFVTVRNSYIVAEKTIIKNLTIEPNMPPKNMRVSSMRALVNRTVIKCSGDAHPPVSTYTWNCSTASGWESNHDKLRFTVPGLYVCECVAENIIGGIPHRSIWRGRLRGRSLSSWKLPDFSLLVGTWTFSMFIIWRSKSITIWSH